MGKWKTKAIQIDLGIIRYIQEIIQVHSEPCVTLAHRESWHINNPGVFRT